MELAPHIPIERCHLVKYNFMKDVIEQSFDLDKVCLLFNCYNYIYYYI